MSKNIEWLKKEIGAEMIELEPNRKERWSDVKYQTLRSVAQKINQLDEPEVLTQEWIDKNVVHVRGLGDIIESETVENLIVPKQESEVLSQGESINIVLDDLKEYIKEQQSLSQNVGLAHTSAGNDTHYRQYDYVLECVNEYEPSDDLQNLLIPKQEVLSHDWIDDNTFVVTDEDGDDYAVVGHATLRNLLVPKQELPVVPTWFDEWWKDVYKGEGNLLHNIAQFHDKLYSSETREVGDYISGPDNKKKLLNIIINELDYVVEDEQKYFVSSRESVGFWFLSKNNDNEVVIGTNKDYYDRKWESLKLTEEEIKDYDSRYWAFAVKVEELEG